MEKNEIFNYLKNKMDYKETCDAKQKEIDERDDEDDIKEVIRLTKERDCSVINIIKKYKNDGSTLTEIMKTIYQYVEIKNVIARKNIPRDFFGFLETVDNVVCFPITVDELSSLIIRLDYSQEISLTFLLSFLRRFPSIISENSFGMILSLSNDILNISDFVQMMKISITMHYKCSFNVMYIAKLIERYIELHDEYVEKSDIMFIVTELIINDETDEMYTQALSRGFTINILDSLECNLNDYNFKKCAIKLFGFICQNKDDFFNDDTRIQKLTCIFDSLLDCRDETIEYFLYCLHFVATKQDGIPEDSIVRVEKMISKANKYIKNLNESEENHQNIKSIIHDLEVFIDREDDGD